MTDGELDEASRRPRRDVGSHRDDDLDAAGERHDRLGLASGERRDGDVDAAGERHDRFGLVFGERRSPALAMLTAMALLLLVPRSAHAQSVPDPDPWWGPDKALHLVFSSAIAGAGYGITAAFTESRPIRLLVGGAAGLLAGTAKELLDLAGLGDPSWKDFTWDVIGTACGVLVAFLLDVFVITPLMQPAGQSG